MTFEEIKTKIEAGETVNLDGVDPEIIERLWDERILGAQEEYVKVAFDDLEHQIQTLIEEWKRVMAIATEKYQQLEDDHNQ